MWWLLLLGLMLADGRGLMAAEEHELAAVATSDSALDAGESVSSMPEHDLPETESDTNLAVDLAGSDAGATDAKTELALTVERATNATKPALARQRLATSQREQQDSADPSESAVDSAVADTGANSFNADLAALDAQQPATAVVPAPRHKPFVPPAAIVVDTPERAKRGSVDQAKKELADVSASSDDDAVTDAQAARATDSDQADADTSDLTGDSTPAPATLDDFVPEVNTNQEGGNWVRKRLWWEQAESAFGTLVANNDAMLQAQKSYFEQRNSTDKLVEAAICKLAVERADLVALLNQLAELAQRTGPVAEPELRLYNLAKANQASLAALQKLFADLAGLDNALDQVLDQLLEQIDRCRDFEKSAWEDFKEIGQILNDQKAKALFYKVDGYQKNVAKVLEYITGPLQKYFMELTLRAKKLSEELLAEVAKLKTAGLDLKFELDVKLGKMPAPVIETAKDREAKAAKKVVAPTGWWQDVTGFFADIWSWLTGLFK